MSIKRVCAILAGILTLWVMACSGKHDDVESTLNEYADAMEAYVTRMEEADSAHAMAKAIIHSPK